MLKTKNKKNTKNFFNITFFVLIIFSFSFFLKYFLNFSKIEVEFLNPPDQNPYITSKESNEENIRELLYIELQKYANTPWKVVFLDDFLITKLIRDEFPEVNKINLTWQPYFINLWDFGIILRAVVVKNDEYFIGCIQEKDRDDFLVWSMQGNSNGEFYKEVGAAACLDSKLLKFTLHPKSLHSKDSEERIIEADSLSGSRVYSKNDFLNLVKIINYLQKSGFTLSGVYINELKLAEIDVNDYVLKTSLEKSAEETIFDFELISKTGKLENYINNRKSHIEYVDLSFKDKVFYKLRKNNKNLKAATSSSEQEETL